MGLILDTNLVITFERELKRRSRGTAAAFIADHQEEGLFVPFIVAGELACGQSAFEWQWRELLSDFKILPWTLEISWKYGELYRALSAQGRLIGPNDLWIAATALVNGMPVVTNNIDEFGRVPGLTVLAF